jgi:hypothetical protein
MSLMELRFTIDCRASVPAGAAAGLNMSPEALQSAIERGSLDVWYVYDGYVPGVRKLKAVCVNPQSHWLRMRNHRRN